jgi:hypothetical protein
MQTWQWVIVGVFGILVLLALSRGVDRTQPATQGCTVMVRPGQSIQQTIDQASPGAVICLAEGSFPSEAEPDPYPPLLITKDLTLQGAGMAKTVITFGIDIRNMLETGEEPVFHVTLQNLSLQGALRISTHARVTIRRVRLQLFARGTERKEPYLAYGGISAGGHVHLKLEAVQVLTGIRGDPGLAFGGEELEIRDSLFFGNEEAGIMISSSKDRTVNVKIRDSLILGNRRTGISLDASWGGHVELIGVGIIGNGTDPQCTRTDLFGDIQRFCNGISIVAEPSWRGPVGGMEIILRDLTIVGNADWGLAAELEQCGYVEDRFTNGRVVFEGTNVIEGNNKLGIHTALGNPGKHPFTDLPPGNVCLP